MMMTRFPTAETLAPAAAQGRVMTVPIRGLALVPPGQIDLISPSQGELFAFSPHPPTPDRRDVFRPIDVAPGIARLIPGPAPSSTALDQALLVATRIDAERAAERPPSDEVFVRCNMLMAHSASAAALAELITAEDARWLLTHRSWSDGASWFLSDQAHGVRHVHEGLHAVRGCAADYLRAAATGTYAGTAERTLLFFTKQATGYGVLTCPDETYQGTFVKGRRHGWGVLTNKLFVHEGAFENDMMQGHGVRTFRVGDGLGVGDRVEGTFQNNERHGQSTLTLEDGSVYQQDFVNERLVRSTLTQAPPNPLPFRLEKDAIVTATSTIGRGPARIIEVLDCGSVILRFCGFHFPDDTWIPPYHVQACIAERDTLPDQPRA